MKVHSIFTHNIQKLSKIQMSINRYKQNVIYANRRIYLCNKKPTTDTNNLNDSQKNYTELKKSDIKDYKKVLKM